MSAKGSVLKVAASQHGAVSRKQALDLGMSRHAIDSAVRNGTFARAARGTLVVAGTPDTWKRRAMVAVLAAGPGAAVADLAAAALLGLIEEEPKTIRVTVPHKRRTGNATRARSLPPQDVRLAFRIPVTCPGRTIVDLAGHIHEHLLEAAIDTALLRGLATIAGLRRYIRSRRLGTRRGVGNVRRILADRERFGIPEGELERRLIRLLDTHRVPQAVRQFPFGDRRIDFAYPELKIAIELDGRADHSKKAVFEDDRHRQNELVLAGWTVLRFTWDDITKRPETVATTIKRALGL